MIVWWAVWGKDRGGGGGDQGGRSSGQDSVWSDQDKARSVPRGASVVPGRYVLTG